MPHRVFPHLLMLTSGFAGLGYQIVWTQQCALWLGHESAAVLAVVSAFFGGLAVGALLLGRRIESSHRPVRWYAACELVIAAWSLLLALAMSPFSTWLVDIIGVRPTPLQQWAVAFCGTFALLLPATAAMGATLPAMERLTAQMRNEGRSIAFLYASNTFGAVIGVLAIAFWLIPELGLLRTAAICIALNLFCCLASVTTLARNAETAIASAQCAPRELCDPPVLPAPTELRESTVRRDPTMLRRNLSHLFFTGLLGIGYEVLVVRVLSQVAEDTVYTFAMLLAVYLVGSAIGAAIYQRWLIRHFAIDKIGGALPCLLSAACLLGTASLWAAAQVKAAALFSFGVSMNAAIGAEAVLAFFAFGPPTLVMGAVFSHLSASVSAAGGSFGRALGINTLGAAIAPLLFGVLAFPLLGPKLALLLLSVGYLALIHPRTWRRPVAWIPAGTALGIAVLAPPLAFIDIPAGGHVVSYQEGVMAAVSVVEDANGVARLRIDNRQQEGSSSTLRVDARQALLPVLLHAAPRHALFLGLGTGITAASAAQIPGLQVDAVELLPEVISASRHFTQAFGDRAQSRPALIAADARRYVKTSKQHYDVIVSDNFHPARSGAGSLYTVEHFAAVRTRLAAGGIFCQWLPLHQLDLQTLRSIVQSFLAAYPHGWAMIASNSLETPVLGLVGRADDNQFDSALLRQRIGSLAQSQELARFGIEDEFALFGSFVAGPKALKRFAGDAPANTDDFPVVAYRAPRITYAQDSLPRDRLITMLKELAIDPDELISNGSSTSTTSTDRASEASWRQRLAAYWQARNSFIELGRDIRPSHDVQYMLAQVREPLLSVLRISPDFRPAYDPLIMMANSLAQTDFAAARALLEELARVQPARPEAHLALSELGDARTIPATN